MKTYTVTLDENGLLKRVNDGFTILELLGLVLVVKEELIQIMQGNFKEEIKEIERVVIKP